MIQDGSGLRVGSDAAIIATFTDAGRPKDTSAYTVTATARIGTAGTPFAPTVTEHSDGTDGRYDVAFDAADLDAAGDLYLEFSFAGTPTINPNAKPIVIPVRAEYEMAS